MDRTVEAEKAEIEIAVGYCKKCCHELLSQIMMSRTAVTNCCHEFRVMSRTAVTLLKLVSRFWNWCDEFLGTKKICSRVGLEKTILSPKYRSSVIFQCASSALFVPWCISRPPGVRFARSKVCNTWVHVLGSYVSSFEVKFQEPMTLWYMPWANIGIITWLISGHNFCYNGSTLIRSVGHRFGRF